ncbi:MAG: GTP 3',8-cyclase MoaA, partial [Pyrinomonadaceae bacterium]
VLDTVMSGIEAARKAQLSPIKINVVVVRGFNEDEVVDFAVFARQHDLQVRFIEFMPLDSGHLWSRDKVVSGAEIKNRIEERFPLIPVGGARGTQTAARYRFADNQPGEVGFISPVTEPFCGACSRIRLTADGMIRTCLFSTTEHNLRDLIRRNSSPEEIAEFITNVVFHKEPHHYINSPDFIQPSRTMSFIGG